MFTLASCARYGALVTFTSTNPPARNPMVDRSADGGSVMAELSRLPGGHADVWDWQLKAACRGEDPNIFFHPEGERGAARAARDAAAKAICASCPVIRQCAEHALAVREPYGVWGSLTEDDRESELAQSRRLANAC